MALDCDADERLRGAQQVGYVRVGLLESENHSQLEGVPLDKIFVDRCSNKDLVRPGLHACLEHLCAGDELHVENLNRIVRSTRELHPLLDNLLAKGVTIRFHEEKLVFADKASPLMRLMLSITGALANLERDLALERQRDGIEAARRAGKYRGGLPKLTTAQIAELHAEVAAGVPKAKVARKFGISRETVYNYLASIE